MKSTYNIAIFDKKVDELIRNIKGADYIIDIE